MKILLKVLVAAALTTAAASCSSFLDINENPNSPTSVAPDAILAQALSTTAATYSINYNSYASWAVDYFGRSGVVNGYAEEATYNYSSQYYQSLWNNTYDNLNDYNLIQQQAENYPNHAAIARIMKVYNFQLLVDEYGDIPYTEALQAAANTLPTYDKAADIYKDLIVQLDGAIADIDAAAKVAGVLTVGNEDIVFGGDMTKWKQFSNSLKMRILLRQSQTNDAALSSYVKTQMATLQNAADGFIQADVVSQPGYAQNSGQQSPFYNRYGFTSAGTQTGERLFQIPTNYIIAQYVKNNDPRITQYYAVGRRRTITGVDTVYTNEYIGTDLGERSPPLFALPIIASRFLSGGTLLKGPTAPTVLMLLSEQLFAKAEAETRGLFAGGDDMAKTDFLDGIKASFLYVYRPASGATIPLAAAADATPGVAQYNTYITANATNPLVNYDLAPANGTLGKQSVIIYQQYLAMNSMASTEAWDAYRRTALPKIEPSLTSNSSRPDKLPARLLYPQTELSTNKANVPTGVTQFMPIFWDAVD